MSKKRRWELRHDMLAPKIWARLPQQDRVLRQIHRSLAQRQADYAEGKGSLLGEPELDAWRAYRPKLAEMEEVAPAVLQYFDDSEAALKRAQDEEKRKQQEELEKEKRLRTQAETARAQAQQARQQAEENAGIATAHATRAKGRTRIAAVLAVLVGVMLVFAVQKCEEAEYQSTIAEREKSRADTARVDAENQAIIAKKEKLRADTARMDAEFARDSLKDAKNKTQAALSSLETNTREAMPVLIRDIDNLILSLDYENALARCKTAWNIDPQNTQVGLRFQEIAFFFTESGAYDKAEDALAYINRKPARFSRKGLLEAIERIDAKYLKDTLETRYYPKMIAVNGGSFCMGRDPKETGSCDTSDTEVILDDFRLGRTEVTVWQYNLYCTASQQDSLERIQRGLDWELEGDNPVLKTSWYDAILYCNWLSRQKGLDPAYPIDTTQVDTNNISEFDDLKWIVSWDSSSKGFRLPTEAEWEYAARGGTKKDNYTYSGGDDLDLVAWWSNNSSGRTHATAKKSVNGSGLHDMSGNVWEWCWDWYDGLETGIISNPRGPDSGPGRVLRGGSWFYVIGWNFEVSYRYRYDPNYRDDNYGFRLSQD